MSRPVTLFTGQWADLPLETLCKKAKQFGYDGLELAPVFPASWRGFTVTRHARGQGVGSALMAAQVDMAGNWFQVRRLELEVYPDNIPAIRLYEKFGFEHEGRMRDFAFQNGAYVDTLKMSRLFD